MSQTLFTLHAVGAIVNLSLGGMWIYLYKEHFKKKSYAVIMFKDGTKPSVKRISMNKQILRMSIKGDKHAFNITEHNLVKIGNKRYLFFDVNGSDAINLLEKENSRLPSDVNRAILENQALKSLNTVPMNLSFDNPIVKYGLIAVGAYLAVTVFA